MVPFLDRAARAAALTPWPKNRASLCIAWLALFGGISYGQSDSVVVFNEIHYHADTEEEWIELHNQMSVDVDISGWRLADGVEFTFPEETVIPGGGYLVVQGEGTSIPDALGPFEGRLNNAGETLSLLSRSDRLMNEVDYGDDGDWPVAPDGSGATLAKVHRDSAAPDSANWTWSTQVGGTPGAINFPDDELPARPLVINEIVGGDLEDFRVELFNRGTASLDITGFRLRDVNDAEFVFGDITLEPGEFHVVSGTDLGFVVATDDLLILVGADESEILDVARMSTESRGRFPDGADEWVSLTAATLGAENEVEISDAIVINEILYHHTPQYKSEGIYGETQTTPLNADWRYFQDGALESDWADEANTDWSTGSGPFGFGFSQGNLPAPLGTTLDPGQITYYFETEFDMGDDAGAVEVQLRALIDDGAVLYVNGVEFERINLPQGEINASTSASSRVDAISFLPVITVPTEFLVPGVNRLSVEVHQNSFLSEDVLFGAEVSLPEVIEPSVPFSVQDEEWVELYNRSDAAVDLTGWSLDDEANFEFPQGTTLEPGGFLIVASDATALSGKYPDAAVIGDFSGNLSNSNGRIRLKDHRGNVADEVHYHDDGRWPGAADGGGASLELKDPHADNASAEAWAASDTVVHTEWREYSMRGIASASTVGPDTRWREFVLGLLDDGEILIDDISVIEDPAGEALQMIPNGTFQTSIFGGGALREWRMVGNHQYGEAVPDPDDPGNTVLRLVASGQTGHMHDHVTTNLAGGRSISNGTEYEISFRARHVSGSPLLHTRLYFNRLAKQWLIAPSHNIGTPGQANSQVVTNLGPTYEKLYHDPPVPSSTESVRVSVQSKDPDGVSGLTLVWAEDGTAFTEVEMSEAPDGVWSGMIPSQSAGTVVQFYVKAEDELGAQSVFPAGGEDSRALYQVDDGRATSGALNNFRIVMRTEDSDWLHNETNLMSSGRIPGTAIYKEKEIYYDVGVRLKGSQRGRVTQPRLGFNVSFPNQQLFRGIHGSVALDRSEGVGFGQREILINHMMTHAGSVAAEYNDLVHVIPPRATYTGPAELQLARYNSTFLDSQFENGSDGFLYEYELIYYPTTTNAEGYKRPQPDEVVGIQLRDLGDSKENYRWSFLTKNNNEQDEFGPMMRYSKLFSLQGDAFFQELDAVVDVPQWLRMMAFASLSGAGDQYAANSGHNGMFYERPDGKVLYFIHDVDFAYEPSRSITENTELRRMIADPVYHRLYLAYLNDIIETTHNSNYLSRWAEHYGELLPGQNFSSHLNFMVSRTNSVRSQVRQAAPSVDFEITTNGGANFESDEPTVVLQGEGWINVKDMLFEEKEMVIEPEWIDFSTWQIVVPLEPGENIITLQARDFQGTTGGLFSPLGDDTITVTYTGEIEPASSENLIISELMYHPADPTDAEHAAGIDDANDFEFLELLNVGTSIIDLTGLTFDRGVNFTFPADVRLAPGERIIVVQNRTAFQLRYGSGIPIAGEWIDSRLSNEGERLTLSRGGGEVVFDMTFGIEAPWPQAADGQGGSLVLVGPESFPDLNEASNWQVSGVSGGTPGAGEIEVPNEGYETWLTEHFTEAERADTQISGLAADPDGDGFANGIEFAFGLNPQVSGPGPQMEVTTGNSVGLSYVRRKDSGLQFTVESSADLEEWTQESWEESSAPESLDDERERISLQPTDGISLTEGFIRLRVEGF